MNLQEGLLDCLLVVTYKELLIIIFSRGSLCPKSFCNMWRTQTCKKFNQLWTGNLLLVQSGHDFRLESSLDPRILIEVTCVDSSNYKCGQQSPWSPYFFFKAKAGIYSCTSIHFMEGIAKL